VCPFSLRGYSSRRLLISSCSMLLATAAPAAVLATEDPKTGNVPMSAADAHSGPGSTKAGANHRTKTSANNTKPSFTVSHGLSHSLQKYTGVTWLTDRALSGVASTALSLKTGGIVHAKIRTYGLTDLFDGEFKSVDVRANGGKLHGVPFGKVHIATDTPFKLHYFQRKGHNSGLRTPVLFNIEGDMAEKDVSHALESHVVSSGLRFLKLDLPGLGSQHLQVLNPKVDLRGNKVILDSFLVTAGADKETGIPLHVEAVPRLDGERKVVLKEMQIQSSEIQDPEHFSAFADELLNPLIDFGRMDRFTHAFRMSKLNVDNERVNYAGKLLLAPKPTDKPTFSAPFIVNSQEAARAQAAAKSASEEKASTSETKTETKTERTTEVRTGTATGSSTANSTERSTERSTESTTGTGAAK
jgi:hypothetical protein